MEMSKKLPLRMCTGCGEMKSKKEMIRVLKTPEDEIVIDSTGKKNGRGAYICCSVSCLQKAIKTKGLERSLKVSIPKELVETLEKEMVLLESGKQENI
ncbi:YlxR family protein [Mobilitalea sibirica]|uniref:YlxR family protein n=2 Tax=Mobilitalea sibirica TaxID=1462919 RepID=A0A8J7KUB6_9FIRM|nr:YlxR family protein [Mobilitalea sibirica]